MKTIAELRAVLDSVPWRRVDAHVHTHLCDGQPEMTVENIGRRAEEAGIGVVVLTPHFHKKVSDETETLYEDSSVEMLVRLREEIDAYRGGTKFLLSTEADILGVDGEICLSFTDEAVQALDLVTPTMNYNPLLPLCMVHLTYGRDIDRLHESGAYRKAAEEAGGIGKVLEAVYECEANAILKIPYPKMVGHFFAAHSIANDLYSWFGAAEEHLPVMKAGAEKLIAACKQTGAMVDLTGLHPKNETPLHKRQKDGFLYDFQRWFLNRCEAEGIPAYPGSDSHGLGGIGSSLCYGEIYDRLD